MIEVVIRDSRLIKGTAIQIHEHMIEDHPELTISNLQAWVVREVRNMLEERNAE